MKKVLAILLALAMIFSLAACGEKKEAKQPEEKDTKYGGSLTLVTVVDPVQSGFPVSAGTDQNNLASTAIERLGRYTEAGTIEGWLAKDFKADPANLTVELTLQEGVKYHDGTPFNAQAVCDVWDILVENGFANKLPADCKYEATGEYTVKVTLSSWTADTIKRLLIDAGQMFSPTVYKENGIDYLYTHIVGTGAFKQEEFVVGEKVTFVKNDEYWVEGLPYLDRIDWIVCTDQTAAMNMLRTGDAKMILYPSIENYATLIDEGFERIGVDSCVNIAGQLGMFFASGNTADPVSKLEVRQAINHAIDNDALVKAFTYGYAVASNQLGVAGSREYSNSVVGYEFSKDKAVAKLAEAGYTTEGSCVVTLTFTPQWEEIFTAVANMIEENTNKIIKVNLDITDNIGPKILVSGDDPYASCCWWSAPSLVYEWHRYYSAHPSTMVGKAVDLQAAGVIDLYQNCLTAKDDAEQKKFMDELAKVTVDDLCLYHAFYATPSFYVGDGTIMDSDFGMSFNQQWKPEQTWIQAK